MPAVVDDLSHTTELVAKLAWGDVPAGAVGESIEALLAARNRIDGALLAAVRSFAARGEHRAEGHMGPGSWLQHHGHLRRRDANRMARLCRFADELPDAGDALLAGEITLAHLEVLADAHRRRDHDAWVAITPLLLDYARSHRFEDFARYVQRFADELRPADADERFTDQLAGRHLSKSTSIDGFAFVRAWMDPISYGIFTTEHERLCHQLFEADWADAKAILGRDPDPVELAELTRTPAQRAHDALVVMAERSRTLAGGKVAETAAVVIHCTQADYEAGLARLLGDHTAKYPEGGFCETDDGTATSPLAAVYLSLRAQVRRIVFSADDEILSYSRGRRIYSDPQAGAIRAKFRRCAHRYGCDRTGPLLQTDHVTEWQDGGPTDLANAQPLCATHNRWKTNQRNRPPPTDTPHDTGQRRPPPPDTS